MERTIVRYGSISKFALSSFLTHKVVRSLVESVHVFLALRYILWRLVISWNRSLVQAIVSYGIVLAEFSGAKSISLASLRIHPSSALSWLQTYERLSVFFWRVCGLLSHWSSSSSLSRESVWQVATSNTVALNRALFFTESIGISIFSESVMNTIILISLLLVK